MKGYKSINEFDLQDCEIFLRLNPNSQYESQIRQRLAKLKAREQEAIQKKQLREQQRQQQEISEQAAKASRLIKWDRILISIFVVLLLIAVLLIIYVFTY